MSIESAIAYKLRESRMIKESEFTSGGSTYKCVFGRYYKDGEEISRDEYFRAQGTQSSSAPTQKKSYEEYTPEEFESTISDFEYKIEDIGDTLSDIPYSMRDDYENALDEIEDELFSMEDYLSDEQYEYVSNLRKKIDNIRNIEYEDPRGGF